MFCNRKSRYSICVIMKRSGLDFPSLEIDRIFEIKIRRPYAQQAYLLINNSRQGESDQKKRIFLFSSKR